MIRYAKVQSKSRLVTCTLWRLIVWQGNSWKGRSFSAVLSGCLSYGLFFGWATIEVIPSEFQSGPFASVDSHQIFLRVVMGVVFLALSFAPSFRSSRACLATAVGLALASSALRLVSTVLGIWSLVLGEVLAGAALAVFLHVWLPRYRSDFGGLLIMLLFGTSICNYVYEGIVGLGSGAVNVAFLLLPVVAAILYHWFPGFGTSDGADDVREAPRCDRLSFVLQAASLLLCNFASGVVALNAHLDAGLGSQIGSTVAFVLATLLTLCGRPRRETLFALAAFGTCLCIASVLTADGASWLIGLRSAGFWTIMMYSFAWFTIEGDSKNDFLSPASLRGMAAIYILSGIAEILGTLFSGDTAGVVALVMVGLALAIALVSASRTSGAATVQQQTPAATVPAAPSPSDAARTLSDRVSLTESERRVFECLSRGYSLRQTAQHLGTTEGAAKFHRHNVYQKLGVTSREELIELVEQTAKDR